MNLRTFKTILELFEASSAVEMELDNATIGKLRLRRPEAGGTAPAAARLPDLPYTAPSAPPAAAATSAAAATPAEDPNTVSVNSPFVGTFYRSPNPESPPFVKVGDTVKKGQTVCIIEAMKLMNELEAEADGVVDAILVENGSAVEHGQPLLKIRPS